MSHDASGFRPLDFHRIPPGESLVRSRAFYELMSRRRSVRSFSSEEFPFEIVENAIRTAGAAPSGANQQPWRYVAVTDPEVKRRIREGAEAEERESYDHRMSREWLDAIRPLGTGWSKPHLTDAPVLIVCFRLDFGLGYDGEGNEIRTKHYYPGESMGISVGMLIAALHHAGLAALTHTPSPMKFLNDILGRPRNERPFVIIPVGYPANGCLVPDIRRKPLDEILVKI